MWVNDVIVSLPFGTLSQKRRITASVSNVGYPQTEKSVLTTITEDKTFSWMTHSSSLIFLQFPHKTVFISQKNPSGSQMFVAIMESKHSAKPFHSPIINLSIWLWSLAISFAINAKDRVKNYQRSFIVRVLTQLIGYRALTQFVAQNNSITNKSWTMRFSPCSFSTPDDFLL